MQVKKLLALATLAAVGAAPFTANADTSTSTFQVQIQIISSCTVTAGSGSNINFGIHTASATTYTGTSNLSVTCDSGVPYNIGLLPTNTGATVNGTGNMKSGSNTVPYTLWQNSGTTTVWGNTIGTNTLTGTGSGAAQSIPVYAKATTTAGQAVGTYTDTVNVTLTY